jgi:hypothetical protein
LASIRLGQSLRSFPRLIPAHLGGTKPYGFLYGATQTSYTAGTLDEIKTENIRRMRRIHVAQKKIYIKNNAKRLRRY